MRHRALRMVAAAVASASLAAQAAGSYVLAASATVLSKSNCKFNTAAGQVLAFGAIDPSSAANATASVTLAFTCLGSAATASYSLDADNGLFSTGPGARRMRNTVNTTQFLAYSLNTPISGSTPKGTTTNLTITGTITPAQFGNAVAGSYSDTLTLTLTP